MGTGRYTVVAMADLIDRGKLIEDLENAKVNFGDIFFRAVLDRAIECVKNQPSVKEGDDHEQG